MAYYLIRTISGKEIEVEQALIELGFAVDLPRCRKMRRLKAFRRHKEVIEPVLSCYVFAELDDASYGKLAGVKHIVAGGIVKMNRTDRKEVSEFLDLVRKGEFNHNGIYGDLMPGQIMRVIGGIFAEMHMIFESVKNGRMHGEIDGRKVEVDAHDAEIASVA